MGIVCFFFTHIRVNTQSLAKPSSFDSYARPTRTMYARFQKSNGAHTVRSHSSDDEKIVYVDPRIRVKK